jgi:hypothetical protein
MYDGRCATRTRDLWFRRPTLYPPELIAHGDFVYYLRAKINNECILMNIDNGRREKFRGVGTDRDTPERGKGQKNGSGKNFCPVEEILLIFYFILDILIKLNFFQCQRSSAGRATDL